MKSKHWWGVIGYLAGAFTGAWLLGIFKKVGA